MISIALISVFLLASFGVSALDCYEQLNSQLCTGAASILVIPSYQPTPFPSSTCKVHVTAEVLNSSPSPIKVEAAQFIGIKDASTCVASSPISVDSTQIEADGAANVTFTVRIDLGWSDGEYVFGVLLYNSASTDPIACGGDFMEVDSENAPQCSWGQALQVVFLLYLA